MPLMPILVQEQLLNWLEFERVCGFGARNASIKKRHSEEQRFL
ncbi:MAG: hypothetical protein ACJAX9_000094 [Celeribacter sp.]|jgi:hypothetical protein